MTPPASGGTLATALKSLAGIGGMGDPCFSKPQIGVCCNALIVAIRLVVDSAIVDPARGDEKAPFLTFA
jgi:hypothetical protein